MITPLLGKEPLNQSSTIDVIVTFKSLSVLGPNDCVVGYVVEPSDELIYHEPPPCGA